MDKNLHRLLFCFKSSKCTYIYITKKKTYLEHRESWTWGPRYVRWPSWVWTIWRRYAGLGPGPWWPLGHHSPSPPGCQGQLETFPLRPRKREWFRMKYKEKIDFSFQNFDRKNWHFFEPAPFLYQASVLATEVNYAGFLSTSIIRGNAILFWTDTVDTRVTLTRTSLIEKLRNLKNLTYERYRVSHDPALHRFDSNGIHIVHLATIGWPSHRHLAVVDVDLVLSHDLGRELDAKVWSTHIFDLGGDGLAVRSCTRPRRYVHKTSWKGEIVYGDSSDRWVDDSIDDLKFRFDELTISSMIWSFVWEGSNSVQTMSKVFSFVCISSYFL